MMTSYFKCRLFNLFVTAALSVSLVTIVAERACAQPILQQDGTTADIETLIQQLKTAKTDEARQAAEIPLGKLGTPAISALLPLLKDRSDWVRVSAIRSLHRMDASAKSAIPIPALIPLLSDAEYVVQLIAALTLGQIGEPALPALLPLLNSQDKWDRRSSAWALGFMENLPESSLPSLLPLLSNVDPLVRSSTANAIATVAPPAQSALPVLMSLLQDPEPSVQISAAKAVVKLGKPEAGLATLIPLLSHSESEVRGNAALTLGFMKEFAPTTIPALKPLLKDKDTRVRLTTAQSLGKLGETETAIATLTSLLSHRNFIYRGDAAEALGSLGDAAKPAIQQLIPLLKDQERMVRSQASEALKKLGYVP
jgi:HEAT repeat protein